MTDEERAIYAILKENPDYVHVTADGSAIYLLVDGGMMCFTGGNYAGMDEAQINLYIQEMLKKKFG